MAPADDQVARAALASVIEVLEGLDEEVQRRILETVAVFLEIKPKKVMRGD